MIYCGIDSGARATKVVLAGKDGAVIARSLEHTSCPPAGAAAVALDKALEHAGASRRDISCITATGYGRNAVEADSRVTEISCHARGATCELAGVRTVIDIGGQDSKVIALGAGGEVEDFVMNDRCAAGTGRFLEVIAAILGVRVCELSDLACASKKPAPISAVCVVFTESEVISLVSQGYEKADIAAGVIRAMGVSLQAILGRLVVRSPALFVGGVAHNVALRDEIASISGLDIGTACHPQFNGALGAALFSLEKTYPKRYIRA